MTLTELAEKIEAATKVFEQADAMNITAAQWTLSHDCTRNQCAAFVRALTGDLNAAIRFTEAVLPGWAGQFNLGDQAVHVWRPDTSWWSAKRGRSSIPSAPGLALAVVAATLRAMEASK